MLLLLTLLAGFILSATLSAWRLLWILNRPRPSTRAPGMPTHLMIVLGSGGHTAEMLSMLRNIDTKKYTHRTYVVSSGDNFSVELARKFETELDKLDEKEGKPPTVSRVAVVPRARKIHQGLLTTPISCLWCLVSCLRTLTLPWARFDLAEPGQKHQLQPSAVPDVILTNGPATAVVVVIASMLLRFLFLGRPRQKMRTVYVESWARVKHLSLSGKLLLWAVDRFIVQWESLRHDTKGKGECMGCLVGV